MTGAIYPQSEGTRQNKVSLFKRSTVNDGSILP